MSYPENGKIWLYFLIKNNVPYYVGVTTRGKQRYSKKKRAHMEIIEYHQNRVSAKQSETFWIEQLSVWGFILENKDLNTKLLPLNRSHNVYVILDGVIERLNTVEKRYKITEAQDQKLLEIERELNIPPSAIVRLALNCFLPKVRDENFKYGGIKDLWDREKF